MVETRLTDELIKEGTLLINSLDKSASSPNAALWFFFPDISTWKLLLSDEKVGRKGPREIYRQVQKALHSLRSKVTHLSLEDIVIAKADAPLLKLLGQAIATGPEVGGIRFSRNVINGVEIEDAYIYRLSRSAAASEARVRKRASA